MITSIGWRCYAKRPAEGDARQFDAAAIPVSMAMNRLPAIAAVRPEQPLLEAH